MTKLLYMLGVDDWESFKVQREVGQVGRWKIDHFTIAENAGEYWHHKTRGRDTGLGEFTGLYYRRDHPSYQTAVNDEYVGQHEWLPMMSDTKAEITDHFEFLDKVSLMCNYEVNHDTSVLITGLGLGMVAEACLRMGVGNVTVVDCDREVVELVAGQIDHPRLHVVVDDAYEWVPDRKFDMAWHDIWATTSDSNLPQMEQMRRHYRRHVRWWQGFWAYERVKWMVRRERQDPTGIMRMLAEPTFTSPVTAQVISLYIHAQEQPQEVWDYLAGTAGDDPERQRYVRHMWQSMMGTRPPGERLVLP